MPPHQLKHREIPAVSCSPLNSGVGIVATQTSTSIRRNPALAESAQCPLQKPTSRRFGTMSAILQRADKLGGIPFVRFVPLFCREQMQQTERYSITSSALASNVCGTARPSALAVLRLITSSY